MDNIKYIKKINGYMIKDEKAREELKALKEREFVKEFKKDDFIQVAKTQRYYIAIPKTEHKLNNPFVEKVILNEMIDSEGNGSSKVAVVCETRLLSTETIKIYVTIDLSAYEEYNGKIYLKGE